MSCSLWLPVIFEFRRQQSDYWWLSWQTLSEWSHFMGFHVKCWVLQPFYLAYAIQYWEIRFQNPYALNIDVTGTLFITPWITTQVIIQILITSGTKLQFYVAGHDGKTSKWPMQLHRNFSYKTLILTFVRWSRASGYFMFLSISQVHT
jgi:hypothetical protein